MNSPVLTALQGYVALEALLAERPINEVHLLTDGRMFHLCSGHLFDKLPALRGVACTKIVLGEEGKTLCTVEHLVERLAEQEMSKNGLLVCFGGGGVSDVGGFAASIYKRGIAHANIPTTLMAQTDAALGGKTAVNLGPIKNVLGTFHWPVLTVLDSAYLATLPNNELINGWAESVKHAIIADAQLFDRIEALGQPRVDDAFLMASAQIKLDIVAADPFEKGFRKALNFGHTVGHAIEGYFLEYQNPIGHGLAIAEGMKVELTLAHRLGLLAEPEYVRAYSLLDKLYGRIIYPDDPTDRLMALMRNDKKNKSGKIGFALPTAIGAVDHNVLVDEAFVREVVY